MPWHAEHAPSTASAKQESAANICAPRGYVPAQEYNIHSRLDSMVMLPRDERVVDVPGECWAATAGGSLSMESTSGTVI